MILNEIVAATRQRVARDLENDTLLKIEARLPDDLVLAARPFAALLKHAKRLGLIAEIKKASPSKGLIAPDFDAAAQAAIYRESNADCLSVLTEPKYFQGDLEHLNTARAISGKPVLRKDFIVDQYQIAQAREYGADCILLIVAILKDWEIRCFKAAAHRYGMDALVEVHSEEEARRAVGNGCRFIGINNRNLQNFEVDLATTERIRPLLPDDCTVVGESGVLTRDDAQRLKNAGVDALLVGESLMRAGNAAQTIEELLR